MTKNSRSSERVFFIHCESNGILSTRRCRVVSHHTFRCVLKICRLDDIQLLAKLMICNSCGIDDIQRQAVDLLPLLCYNTPKAW